MKEMVIDKQKHERTLLYLDGFFLGCCSLWFFSVGIVCDRVTIDEGGVSDLLKVIVSQVVGLLAPEIFRVVCHVFDEADDVLD